MSLAHSTQVGARRLGDAKAVGRVLDLSRRTVYRLAAAGKIPPGHRLGASTRWDMAEIEAFIAGGCKPPCQNRRAAWVRFLNSRSSRSIATVLGTLWAALRLAAFAVEHPWWH
jgi:predicted DNA-binding transcriptional regulator AlpA